MCVIKVPRLNGQILSTLIIVFGLISSQTALAQPFPQSPSSTTIVEPNFKPPAYCPKSSLSKLDFLSLLSNIIDHGDLHDLEFTEKILGTKLTARFVNDSNIRTIVYKSDRVRGYPISVIVGLDKTYKFTGGKKNSYVSFESNLTPIETNFLTQCIHLVTSDFSNHFGAGFFVGLPVGNVPTSGSSYGLSKFLSASKTFITSNGKKSQFGISINYDTSDLVVDSVGIGQQN